MPTVQPQSCGFTEPFTPPVVAPTAHGIQLHIQQREQREAAARLPNLRELGLVERVWTRHTRRLASNGEGTRRAVLQAHKFSNACERPRLTAHTVSSRDCPKVPAVQFAHTLIPLTPAKVPALHLTLHACIVEFQHANAMSYQLSWPGSV